MNARGRPAGKVNTLTRRRRQVLQVYADLVAEGESVRFAEVARRCGLYSYRDARRVFRDLEIIGAV